MRRVHLLQFGNRISAVSLLLLVSTIAAVLQPALSALAGTSCPPYSYEYGRCDSRGYFTGINYSNQVYGGYNTLGEVVNNNAFEPSLGYNETPRNLPNSYKATFIQNVMDWYGGSIDRESQIGAAFVMNVMMGHNGPGWGRNPSAAEIQQWKDAINQSNVSVRVQNWTNKINSGYAYGINDDVFFTTARASDKAAIVFYDKNNGTVYSVIKMSCANPLGQQVGIQQPAPKPISLVPKVAVDTPLAMPGTTVNFTYSVNDSGSQTLTSAWNLQQFVCGGPLPAPDPRPQPYTMPAAPYACRDLPQVDIGSGATENSACQTYTGTASNGANYRDHWQVVGYDKKGNPIYGWVRVSTPVPACQILNPSVLPGNADVDGSYRPGPNGPNANNGTFASGTTSLGGDSFTIPTNAVLGEQYCRWIALANAGIDSSGGSIINRWGAAACVKVGYFPMVYFDNGDVWAGGAYNPGNGRCQASSKIYTASNPTVGSNTYVSSNAQLAAFATSSIEGFATAGKTWNGSAGSSPLYDSLMFANKQVPGNVPGSSGMSHCLTDYYDSFNGGSPSNGTVNLDLVPSGSVLRYHNVVLQVSRPGAVITGKITVVADGTVEVASDLVYSAAKVADIAHLPLLVVGSKGNMTVDDNVGEIDGIYQTKGTFFTCLERPVSGTPPRCPKQLQVRGSVIASVAALRRTGGDVASKVRTANPAEDFNLTPSTILGSSSGPASGQFQLKIVSEKELPPRY